MSVPASTPVSVSTTTVALGPMDRSQLRVNPYGSLVPRIVQREASTTFAAVVVLEMPSTVRFNDEMDAADGEQSADNAYSDGYTQSDQVVPSDEDAQSIDVELSDDVELSEAEAETKRIDAESRRAFRVTVSLSPSLDPLTAPGFEAIMTSVLRLELSLTERLKELLGDPVFGYFALSQADRIQKLTAAAISAAEAQLNDGNFGRQKRPFRAVLVAAPPEALDETTLRYTDSSTDDIIDWEDSLRDVHRARSLLWVYEGRPADTCPAYQEMKLVRQGESARVESEQSDQGEEQSGGQGDEQSGGQGEVWDE